MCATCLAAGSTPTIQNDKYKETVLNGFDYAVLPIPWRMLQPTEQDFVTQQIDEWVELLSRKRMPIIAGPLIQLSERDVPDWMYIWENEFDTMRDLCLEYIQKVVYRYRKAVSVWNVVAGLGSNTMFPMSFEQCIEFTRLLVAQVKNVMPGARTLVSICHPFGEHRQRMTTGAPPLLYAEMVAAIGHQLRGVRHRDGSGHPRARPVHARLVPVFLPARPLLRVWQVQLLLHDGSVGVPSRSTADPSDRHDGKYIPANAGRWRRPWE